MGRGRSLNPSYIAVANYEQFSRKHHQRGYNLVPTKLLALRNDDELTRIIELLCILALGENSVNNNHGKWSEWSTNYRLSPGSRMAMRELQRDPG